MPALNRRVAAQSHRHVGNRRTLYAMQERLLVLSHIASPSLCGIVSGQALMRLGSFTSAERFRHGLL